jgi:hypothetical protein
MNLTASAMPQVPEPTGFLVFGIGAMVAAAGAATTRRREASAWSESRGGV